MFLKQYSFADTFVVSGTSGITSPTICGKNGGQHSKCTFDLAGVDSISTCHGHWLISRTTDTQTERFFKNSKLLGLGRQIGPKFYEAFGVFLAKL